MAVTEETQMPATYTELHNELVWFACDARSASLGNKPLVEPFTGTLTGRKSFSQTLRMMDGMNYSFDEESELDQRAERLEQLTIALSDRVEDTRYFQKSRDDHDVENPRNRITEKNLHIRVFNLDGEQCAVVSDELYYGPSFKNRTIVVDFPDDVEEKVQELSAGMEEQEVDIEQQSSPTA